MQKSGFIAKYGPWAIVTGASSGLGAEFAEQLARKGLHLILVARRKDKLEELAVRLQQEYSVMTKVVAVDLSEPDFLAVILRETETLDVGLLVNNAGYSKTGEFFDGAIEDEMKMLNVNCRAPVGLAMAFGKKMVARGNGGIVFVSSSVGFSPTPFWTHYAATKAYTMFLGEGLFHELKKKGVDVLALCPGGMRTEFQQIAGIDDFGAMPVKPVVSYALKHLGRKSSVIPGWHVRLLFYHLPKLFPRRLNLAFFAFMISKLQKKQEGKPLHF